MSIVLSDKGIENFLEALSRAESDEDCLMKEHPGIRKGISDEDLLEEMAKEGVLGPGDAGIKSLLRALESCEEDQGEENIVNQQ